MDQLEQEMRLTPAEGDRLEGMIRSGEINRYAGGYGLGNLSAALAPLTREGGGIARGSFEVAFAAVAHAMGQGTPVQG